LYEIIQEYTYEKMHHEQYKVRIFMNNLKDHLLPTTSEQQYYRCIFEEEYRGLGKVVPYFWMPKYVEAKDASARTLAIYSKTEPSKDCCC
jgi:asparagine synthase (glutamine-hydrolysing)